MDDISLQGVEQVSDSIEKLSFGGEFVLCCAAEVVYSSSQMRMCL